VPGPPLTLFRDKATSPPPSARMNLPIDVGSVAPSWHCAELHRGPGRASVQHVTELGQADVEQLGAVVHGRRRRGRRERREVARQRACAW
jgi:hypothetical protein